jgi:hypothetical protein
MGRKKKRHTPEEIAKELGLLRDLETVYMKLVENGYSGEVVAHALKLFAQGKDIVDFLKKQSRPIPVQY